MTGNTLAGAKITPAKKTEIGNGEIYRSDREPATNPLIRGSVSCQYCHQPIQWPRANQKYCSDSCRVRACRKRKGAGQ